MDKKIKPTGFSRLKIIYLSVALLLAMLLGYVLLKGSQRSVRLDTSNLVLKTVKRAPFQEFISVDANILPKKTVIIDALISGKIIHKYVEDGTELSAGQPILELENIDLQLDILNRETAVLDLINNIRQTRINLGLNTANRQKERADIQYQLKEAQRNFDMNKSLWADSVISRSEYEESLNQYNYAVRKSHLLDVISRQDSVSSYEQINQMEASLRQSNKNLELMKTKLKDLVIKAPIDGQLTNFDLELGQLINTGENIGQMDVTSGFKIRAQADQFYLNRMTIGQKASASMNGRNYQLTISRVYPTVQNSLFAIDLEFEDEQPAGITRGQNLVVRIELSTQREAVVVPRGGFYQSTGGQWIYRVDEQSGEAIRVNIKLGKQNPSFFEVLEGLQPGDRVITSGYQGFDDYTKLKLKK